MRNLVLFLCFTVCASAASGQSLELGLLGGISNYQGDLTDKVYAGKLSKAALGLTATYQLTGRIALRGGLTFAKVAGDDRYNEKDYLRARNLNFESRITELSLVGEFSTFNVSEKRWSPYAFGGLALFRFNPYTFDPIDNKVFLKPLSTEGQGLSRYPERRPYALTQLALPFGGGVKLAINENIRIGAEVGLRYLFTDHLDDVSTTYADPVDLLEERGQLAVDYSYRGDEIAGGDPTYPAKGVQRGGAEVKDLYYFTGLTLSFRLPGGNPNTRVFSTGKGRRGISCPKLPL